MATVPETLSAQDLEVAERLIQNLWEHGRSDEARVVVKLLAHIGLEAKPTLAGPLEDELAAEDLAAIDRGLADIAAGRTVPHEVVLRGTEAMEAYRKARDARLRAASNTA